MFIHTGGMLYRYRDGIFLVSILTVTSNNNDDDGNYAKNDGESHNSKLRIIEGLFAIQTFFAGIRNKSCHTLNTHFLHHPGTVTFYRALT